MVQVLAHICHQIGIRVLYLWVHAVLTHNAIAMHLASKQMSKWKNVNGIYLCYCPSINYSEWSSINRLISMQELKFVSQAQILPIQRCCGKVRLAHTNFSFTFVLSISFHSIPFIFRSFLLLLLLPGVHCVHCAYWMRCNRCGASNHVDIDDDIIINVIRSLLSEFMACRLSNLFGQYRILCVIPISFRRKKKR